MVDHLDLAAHPRHLGAKVLHRLHLQDVLLTPRARDLLELRHAPPDAFPHRYGNQASLMNDLGVTAEKVAAAVREPLR